MAFTVDIVRGKTSGTLKFKSGSVKVDTTCWWDKTVTVDAGTYTGYATHMAKKKDSVTKKKRPGIWFGKNIPVNGNSRKSSDIFIHEGNNAAWSDGCIVAVRSEVLKIWNAISPKEKANVTINVSDKK